MGVGGQHYQQLPEQGHTGSKATCSPLSAQCGGEMRKPASPSGERFPFSRLSPSLERRERVTPGPRTFTLTPMQWVISFCRLLL